MGPKIRFALLGSALVCGLVCYCYAIFVKPSGKRDLPRQIDQEFVDIDFSKRVPVALNRGSEVSDGFRGEVHPVLHRHGELKLTADWNFDRNQNRDPGFLHNWPLEVHNLFLTLNVSIPTKTYTERDFSRFLPAKELDAVGQMWALDLEKVSEFLKQFHPAPSMRLIAKGRRAGPDGAFAVLRAVSATHLDVLFRVHAEFDVLPNFEKGRSLVSEAWYSPGSFLGRMVINRKEGTVEYFRLGVPTDLRYHVHVSVASKDQTDGHGWMRVDFMELISGTSASIDNLRWDEQIETADAHERLAKIFYKFKQIDWVAFDGIQEAARAKKKPIFVVAAMGALDNQTC
jgi:hypothetical protein